MRDGELMAERTNRNIETRMEAATHIAYEIRMCGAAMYQLRNAEKNTFVGKIYLESLLLHVRILREFFCLPRKYRDDMRPDDFLGPSWVPPEYASRALSDEVGQLTNKHLAHLTWGRVANGNPQWPCAYITQNIVTIAASWLEHLRIHDPLVADEIEDAILELRVLARDHGPFMDMTYGS